MILCPDDRYVDALIRCDEMMERSLGGLDIYCGRGKGKWNSPGNRRFKQLVHEYLKQYSDAPSKAEKSRIVESVVEAVSKLGGRFLKQEEPPNGPWYEIDPIETRKKVAHAIRDHLATRKKHTATSSLAKGVHKPFRSKQGRMVEELQKFTSEGHFLKNTKQKQPSDDGSENSVSLLGEAGTSRSGADGNLSFTPAFQQQAESACTRPAFLPAPPPRAALEATPTPSSSTMLLMSRTDNDQMPTPEMLLQQQQRYNMMTLLGLHTPGTALPNLMRSSGTPPGALVLPSQATQQMQHQFGTRPHQLPDIPLGQASSAAGPSQGGVNAAAGGGFAGDGNRSTSWPYPEQSQRAATSDYLHRNSFSIMDTFNSSLGPGSVGGGNYAPGGRGDGPSSFQQAGMLLSGDVNAPLGTHRAVPREPVEMGTSLLTTLPRQPETDKPSINVHNSNLMGAQAPSFPPELHPSSLQHRQATVLQHPAGQGELSTRNGSVLPPMSSFGAFDSQVFPQSHSALAVPHVAAAEGGSPHGVAPLGLTGTGSEEKSTVAATEDDQGVTPLVSRSLPYGVQRQSWDFVGESFPTDDEDMNPHSLFPPPK